VSKVGDTGMNKSKLMKAKLIMLALLGAVTTHSALAEITLSNIDFTALPGNEFEMQLQFSEQPPQPQSYTLENPARIVLDFPGVESALEAKKHPLSFENADSAVVLTADGKTRVIVNLKKMTAFDSAISGNTFNLTIGESGLAYDRSEPASEYIASAPAGGSSSSRAISNVDFSRGEAGEGLVKLEINNPNVSVDVQQVGSKISLSFFNTSLPSELDRRLDVLDFATPVKAIDTKQEGSTTKVTIDAVGDYDYLAYQADGQYVVSVKPLSPEELEEKNAKFAFVGEKLSLNFQDIEVRSVLQLIADFTDLNLVASDTVSGNITLRLDNVPWDQALDIVLKAKGLDKRLEGNVLMVAPAAEIAERERLQVEANKQLQELAPLVTEFVRVKYADAKELFELFDVDENETGGSSSDDRTATKSILSERGSAIVDQRTNTIILTDTEEKILEFRRLVDKIDIPVRQVEISARIVVATTDFSKEVGVRWGIAGLKESGGNLFTVVGTRQGQKTGGVIDAFTIDSTEIDDEGNIVNTSDLTLAETLAVDLGVSDQRGPAGSISLGFLSNDIALDLELSALESSGYGEIASQPKLLTGDKQKAVIRSGQEIAFQEATSSGATSVEFKEAVLKLEVTPQITPDNRVILDLFISQDSLSDLVVSGEPALDITDIETQALVGDGQTLVLGGIFQYTELEGEEKVPLLGDIPYLGRLFKNKLRNSEKREILIFITPKIIDDQLLDR
jgi:type IV pilus assembly protein PilQ